MTRFFSGNSFVARFDRLLRKRSFEKVAANVLCTAPLRIQGTSPLFLSMICHRDLAYYLLAIKSIYARVKQGRVLIINDGSLTSTDVKQLSYHIPGIEIVNKQSISVGPAPRADLFWERLVKIVDLTRDNYVIQVDADTLVSAEIPEVIQCWRQNRSFLLGTASGQLIRRA